MHLRLLCFLSVLLLGSGASAAAFDWRDASTRKDMVIAFDHMSVACSSGFGFTRIPPLPSATMVDKLHAFLLLRSDSEADAQVEAWAIQVIAPVNAMVAKKSEGADAEGDHSAAAAAVAAAEDPDSSAEAKERFMKGAMAPFRRGLEASASGARDPFLGKYYWTGTGNADDFERSMDAYFSELVADLRKPPKPASRKRR